jgi:hypothetical protein
MHTLNLKSQKEWLEYCHSGEKPDDIPVKPYRTYSGKRLDKFGRLAG